MSYLSEDPDWGARRVYGNSHLTIAGASANPMLAMSCTRVVRRTWADLDILLREAA
ncbi:MAG: hypothetical protein OXQ28_03515 [Acidobacteriota bacterium]|nr:hypothetical protein [Acidobacteriota bacterium]